jgi:hypothetical protein
MKSVVKINSLQKTSSKPCSARRRRPDPPSTTSTHDITHGLRRVRIFGGRRAATPQRLAAVLKVTIGHLWSTLGLR